MFSPTSTAASIMPPATVSSSAAAAAAQFQLVPAGCCHSIAGVPDGDAAMNAYGLFGGLLEPKSEAPMLDHMGDYGIGFFELMGHAGGVLTNATQLDSSGISPASAGIESGRQSSADSIGEDEIARALLMDYSMIKVEVEEADEEQYAGRTCGQLRGGGEYDNDVKGQLCAVCGDFATGFHYDVSSCNGCKTFFRRTVVANRNFVCRRGGNCQFGKDRRCACRACRFKRCVAVGMNTQAIQYKPTAKLTLSIVRKRFQRSPVACAPTNAIAAAPPPSSHFKLADPSRGLVGVQDEVLSCIETVLRLEEKHDHLRASSFHPYQKALRLVDALQLPSAFGEAHKYPLVEKWPVRPPAIHPQPRPAGVKFWLFTDIYLTIDYLKTFRVFRQLSLEDRVALVRSVAVSSSHLTSGFYSFGKQCAIIVYPDGSHPAAHRHNEITEMEHKLRKGSVDHVCALRPDQIQYSLLHAILCLNDSCDELSPWARERIAEERSRYTRALLHYLQNRHGVAEGTRRFGDTMMTLTALYCQPHVNYTYFAYRSCVTRDADPSVLFHETMRDH